jgi:FMN phosphatase YigB (HAD superfamily)
MASRSVDAVLLDMGNVLVFHDNALLHRRLAEHAGIPLSLLESRLPATFWWRSNLGVLDENGIREALSLALGVALTPDAFFELWSCHFRLHEAVFPLVESLVGQVKLALVSNTNAAHMRWVRPRVPLLERFDALVLSHETGVSKPDPHIYREGLRRVGTAAERTAFFDDTVQYVEAANRLGLQGRVFTTADAFREQLRALGLRV